MSAPIRILNLFTIMNRGGAETMVMNYYRSIDRTKVQFDFMVHRKEKGAYDDEIEAMGGKIYRMSPIFPTKFGRYKKELKQFFDEHPEYQIVHSHMSELGYFAFKEAKAHGVKCLICHAHNAPNFKSETVSEKIKDFMRWNFKHKIRKYTDYMFGCSKDACKWLFGRRNVRKCMIINNAVDAEKFRWNPERAKKLRKIYGTENKFVICHVGRFNVQKNHDFLIDIFNVIHHKNPNSVLILVGNGELEDRIKSKVGQMGLSDCVIFAGARDDINDILLSSDVFLFPSLYEGLGVALIEAQASGIKSITSDTIPKLCFITRNIKSVELSAEPTVWADAVLKYADGYKRKDTYGTIAEKGFDIKENAAWLEEFYINEYCK